MKDFNRVISSKSIEQIDRIELRSIDSGRKNNHSKPPLYNNIKTIYCVGIGYNDSLKELEAYKSVGLPAEKNQANNALSLSKFVSQTPEKN